jgi:hypothetical protein
MHEKNMGSRSRAYRLNVEQLERRSMLTGDAEEVFFDWSQFDAAESFDPWLDAWAAFNDAGGQPWDTDPTWFFGEELEEQWPAEPEASLPEIVTEDAVGEDAVEDAPADAWSTTDSQVDDSQVDDSQVDDSQVDDSQVNEEQVTDEVGVYAPGEEVDSPSTTAVDAGDSGAVEDTTAPAPEQDNPLPFETEAVTMEPPLSTDEPDAELPPEEFTGEEFTGDGYEETLGPVDQGFEPETGSETATDASGNLPEETFDTGEDAGDLPEDVAYLDDLLPLAGDEGVAEETSSLPEDLSSLPVPAPTSGPSALPRAVSAPRSAAFAAMRMFGGFSFMPQPDDASDGPVFAGGRRRPRR